MRSLFRSKRQRAFVESPYHKADDLSARATTITEDVSVSRKAEQDPVVQPLPCKTVVELSPSAKAALNAFQYTLDTSGKTPIPGIGVEDVSVTRKAEQDPVVQPLPCKTAVELSPSAKAAFNALQCTLDALGKTPIPGIGAVTATLLHIVKGVQEIPQVAAGWKELAERMARLSFLMRKICAAPELQNEIEQYCTPLNEELGKLSGDIDRASKQGKLVNFFTSTDALASLSEHQKKLDSMINDLTAALCMNTALTKVELRTHLDEIVSRLHEEMLSKRLASDESGILMTRNTIDGILGSVGTNNKFSGKAKIIASSNKIGLVNGSMFSDNTFGP